MQESILYIEGGTAREKGREGDRERERKRRREGERERGREGEGLKKRIEL